MNIKNRLIEIFLKKKHFFPVPEILAMDQNEQLHSIQQLSTKLNIPKPTLRFWEKEFGGILVPLRTNGGQRRYSHEHASIIEKVKNLRKRGVPLAEIKRRFNRSDISDMSAQKEIEILANKLGKLVKEEIYKFYNLELENKHFS